MPSFCTITSLFRSSVGVTGIRHIKSPNLFLLLIIPALSQGNKGLYVSTGRFSQEAKYEAERLSTPITLIDIDSLVNLVNQYYDSMDSDTKALIPLKKIYWPE